MKIVSIYPAPFDVQLRHEANSSILSNNKIYAYEEGKITSVKNEPTSLFPEKSLMMGFLNRLLNGVLSRLTSYQMKLIQLF